MLDETACLHRLTALEGAARGVRKSELSEQVRQQLAAFYMALE